LDSGFVGSFPRADAVLDPPLPEIAFLGRSNVGKSSLLNALLGRRLARVSAEPGKTRLLNVYVMGRGDMPDERLSHVPRPTPHALYLLDLPGYGYARASRTERAGFRRLVEGTLSRPRLAGIVWLLDIRRDPSAQDLDMQDALHGQATRVLAALTKGDKLSRAQRLAQERNIREALQLDEHQVITTSVKTGDGIRELREAIGGLIGGAE
jgi:GTP-binding protein